MRSWDELGTNPPDMGLADRKEGAPVKKRQVSERQQGKEAERLQGQEQTG